MDTAMRGSDDVMLSQNRSRATRYNFNFFNIPCLTTVPDHQALMA